MGRELMVRSGALADFVNTQQPDGQQISFARKVVDCMVEGGYMEPTRSRSRLSAVYGRSPACSLQSG